MSSETFTTAMFLIAAIISAGVLVNAVFPVVYQLSGTISSSSHQVDQRMRTDVKIVATYASDSTDTARVWLKNVGTSRIASTEIDKSDVMIGSTTDFDRASRVSSITGDKQWTYEIVDDTNGSWDTGETLFITARSSKIPSHTTGEVYFQFILTTGLTRSVEFTASD